MKARFPLKSQFPSADAKKGADITNPNLKNPRITAW
jgi:hypothetical protein